MMFPEELWSAFYGLRFVSFTDTFLRHSQSAFLAELAALLHMHGIDCQRLFRRSLPRSVVTDIMGPVITGVVVPIEASPIPCCR